MMTMLSFFRTIAFGFQNFVRNIWLTLATISVLVLTLVSVNVLLMMNVIGRVALDTVKDKIDVSVHFRPDVEESRVQTVRITLLSLPEVRDVELITAEQALEAFAQQYEADPVVLASLGEVGENPFGATLIVKARSIGDYDAILTALDQQAFAGLIEDKDFDDRQAMIDRVEGVAGKIELSMLFVSFVFGIITLLIVFNTIRVSIYTHREEIAIMRLVGASDAFIRTPFYVEAVLWSVAAVALTALILAPGIVVAQPYVQHFFGTGSIDLAGFYAANAVTIVGAQFCAIALLSLLTTKVATSRYLNV